jgi:endogenous inhibitor of DNA gyrase (YacG/DUF329 family)
MTRVVHVGVALGRSTGRRSRALGIRARSWRPDITQLSLVNRPLDSPTQRRSARPARLDAPARSSHVDAPSLPTRQEFRARCSPAGTGWRALRQRPSGRELASLLGGLALGIGGFALMWPLAELSARDPRLQQLPWWWLFPPCWSLVLLGLWVLHRGTVADLRRRGLACPTCGSPLLDVSASAGRPYRYELVMATGRCPSCGAPVLRDGD